jgi:general secretion pathway protein J
LGAFEMLHIERIRFQQENGFTLVELLVALALMALLTAMSWRVIDGIENAKNANRKYVDTLLTLEAGLNQWEADLDALMATPKIQPLEWDGLAIRLTRVSPGEGGAVVVCWTRAERDGVMRWLRWESESVKTSEEWQAAWAASKAWAERSDLGFKSREVRIADVTQWQLYFFRAGAWSNSLSSPGSSQLQDASLNLPEGIRLTLTLPAQQPMRGTLVRDWSRSIEFGALP